MRVAYAVGALLSPAAAFHGQGPFLPKYDATMRHGSRASRLHGGLRMVLTNPKPSVVAPPPDQTDVQKRKRLHVQIEDGVYDLTGWRAKHPAGAHWLDRFQGQDATDVIYAFHSDEALDMFRKFPQVKGAKPRETNEVTRSFREFRKQLVRDGWFTRKWPQEGMYLALQLLTMVGGIAIAHSHPLLATLVLGFGHTTGGWLAHDYVHGRGKWCSTMRNFGAVCCGLSSKWWSEKHNKHHAFTNVVGVDEDIMVEPLLYLWPPTKERDLPLGIRSLQHLYWPLPFSLTFLVWRVASVVTCVKERLWTEGSCLALHYLLLAALVPLPVAIGHVFLGGLLTATLVTVTHTAEEYLLDSEEPLSFVEAQFRTSRDAKCHDPVSEYVWGGMQYQLEHHLFPTVPRYKYPALAPLVQQFAADNGLEYRVTDQWKILSDNVKNLERVGASPTDALSPSPGSCDLVVER